VVPVLPALNSLITPPAPSGLLDASFAASFCENPIKADAKVSSVVTQLAADGNDRLLVSGYYRCDGDSKDTLFVMRLLNTGQRDLTFALKDYSPCSSIMPLGIIRHFVCSERW